MGSTFPLTKRVLVSSFRNALELAGVPDALSFRGHSFRRGAATWAFRIGIPGEIIQLYGGWSSEAYKLYLDFSLESKVSVASLMRKALLAV